MSHYSIYKTEKGIVLKKYRVDKPLIIFKPDDVVFVHRKDGSVSKILISDGEIKIG